MVHAYLSSLLSRQLLLLKSEFKKRYACCWLVWEPGSGSVPTGDVVAETQLPTGRPPQSPKTGDALCFALGNRSVSVGRHPHNDVMINDATISRDHLIIGPCAGGWAVTPASGAKPLWVSSKRVPAGVETKVKDGDEVRVGDVVLTFHDAGGLYGRIEAEATRLMTG
jgi:hypothetical protein